LNFDLFFKEVGKHELLTKEQEVQLAQAIEAGDMMARDRMIQSNLRLAISIAKQYNKSGCALEDLIQESTVGLMQAVDRFDWRRGFKFSTYACWWIKQAVRRHVTSNSSMIRLPNHARTVLWQASQMRKDYIESFGTEPKLEEIAGILGIGTETLRSLQQSASSMISLDANVGKADGDSRKLYEVIPDTEAMSVDDAIAQEDVKNVIRAALRSLSPREEKVMRLRFGIVESVNDHHNFPITQSEINKLEERSNANA
jgi:RNA polymerase primary sigma factor